MSSTRWSRLLDQELYGDQRALWLFFLMDNYYPLSPLSLTAFNTFTHFSQLHYHRLSSCNFTLMSQARELY